MMKGQNNIPFVLTIFDSERCVTTIKDLEAAAKAIHQKADREAETSGNTFTFAGNIEGKIRLINAESASSETELQSS